MEAWICLASICLMAAATFGSAGPALIASWARIIGEIQIRHSSIHIVGGIQRRLFMAYWSKSSRGSVVGRHAFSEAEHLTCASRVTKYYQGSFIGGGNHG